MVFRIDNSTAAGALPAIPVAGVEGFFREEDAGAAIPATTVEAWWLNMVQEEIYKVVTDAGMAPDKADNGQLSAAVQSLIAANTPAVAQDRLYITGQSFAGSVVDGDVVRWSSASSEWVAAIADGTASNEGVGLADVTAGEVTLYGRHSTGIAGLTPGTTYFLSAATAGAIVAVSPTDSIKVGLAKAADILWVDIDPMKASETYDFELKAGWGADGTGEDLVANQLIGVIYTKAVVTLADMVGAIEVAPTGADMTFDCQVDGLSVYTTLPKIVAGATSITPGVFAAGKDVVAAGKIIKWIIPQIGSTIAGQRLVAIQGAKV